MSEHSDRIQERELDTTTAIAFAQEISRELLLDRLVVRLLEILPLEMRRSRKPTGCGRDALLLPYPVMRSPSRLRFKGGERLRSNY